MSGTYKRDPFGDGKVWAILLGGALALVAVLYLLACGSPPPPLPPAKVDAVTACQLAIVANISQRRTCPEAQLAINADDACHALYPKGLSLDCPEHRP